MSRSKQETRSASLENAAREEAIVVSGVVSKDQLARYGDDPGPTSVVANTLGNYDDIRVIGPLFPFLYRSVQTIWSIRTSQG